MKMKNAFLFLMIASLLLGTVSGCGIEQTGNGTGTEIESGDESDKADTMEVKDALSKIESEYELNSTIWVPDAYFTDGSNHIEATKSVIYPDGRQYTKDEFITTEMGKYYVEYSASTDSNDYMERKEIYVYADLYSVKNVTDKLYYGVNELTPNTYGLNVGLEEGSSFYYNKVIDFNELKGKPFISLYMAPEKVKEADGLDLIITLTDAYDETNYVDIWVRCTRETSTWQHGASYISAGATNQGRAGLEFGSKLHKDNLWGFGQDFSFFGCDTSGNTDEELLTSKTRSNGQLQLFLDLETLVLSTHGSSAGVKDVIDFDNPDYFTELWNGFTTGEAYLSIKASSVSKTHLNFVITEIGGNELADNKSADDVAPYIGVDTLNYEELPQAVTNIPYPIFDAKAIDAYGGNIDMNVAVYRNYGHPSQSNVNVMDGKFIPTIQGTYYLVYSATDYSGNYAEKVFPINCVVEGEAILLDVEEVERETEAYVGEYVHLPAYTVSGGNGNVSVDKTVVDANGKSAEIVDNEFKVLTEGKYTITYTATDYIGRQENYSYTVKADISDKPVFDKNPVFPKYIISGYEYTIPELKAFDYSNDAKEVPVTVKVTGEDGEQILGQDRKMTFGVKNAGECKNVMVTYEATGDSGVSSRTYEVKVISTKQLIDGEQRLDVSKYFYSESVNVKADELDVKLNTSKNGSVEFINTLIASGFNVKFVTSETSSLGALKLVVEDSIDSTKKIEILLKEGSDSDKTKYTVNDGTSEFRISSPYEGGEFTLVYDDMRKAISLDNTNYVTLKQFADGSTFEGFTSGKVRLYFEFVDVKGQCGISVKEINSQGLRKDVVLDRVMPWVVTQSLGNRAKNIGEIITIDQAVAGDVLDPNVQLAIEVLGPDGKPVKGVDGTVLSNLSNDQSYQFELTEYGNYRIRYTVCDTAGNQLVYPVTINVVDVEAPKITLSRNNISKTKKDSVIVIAPVTVSDNNSTPEDIIVSCFIIRPCGMKFTIDMNDSNSFIASETGTYTIRYMAFDQMGNITILDNEVTVTE